MSDIQVFNKLNAVSLFLVWGGPLCPDWSKAISKDYVFVFVFFLMEAYSFQTSFEVEGNLIWFPEPLHCLMAGKGLRVIPIFSHLLSNSNRSMVHNHVSRSWHYWHFEHFGIFCDMRAELCIMRCLTVSLASITLSPLVMTIKNVSRNLGWEEGTKFPTVGNHWYRMTKFLT